MITNRLRYLFVAAVLIPTFSLQAQVFKFDHGSIEFYTGTVVSDIEAISEKADVTLNLNTRKISVVIDIESFEFDYELMQKHFNEKYMESEKFPQSKFTGEISQDISGGIENDMAVDVAGKLSIHGVTNDIKFKATLSKQGEFIVVKAKFPVVFKDYGIDDPSILSKSVAKDVEIKSTLYMKQPLL